MRNTTGLSLYVHTCFAADPLIHAQAALASMFVCLLFLWHRPSIILALSVEGKMRGKQEMGRFVNGPRLEANGTLVKDM